MNLISRILSGPAIAQLRELVAAVTKTRERLAVFANQAEARRAEVEQLRVKFFATLADEDFAAWCEARQRLDSQIACSNDAGIAQSWRAEATLETDTARELILAALRDSANALSKEVDALAKAEKQRLADAGVEDAAENPGLEKVRARIRELAECHDDLKTRAEVALWRAHKSRYLAALNLR